MTEKAIKSVKKPKQWQEASDQHVEASSPGELISQDHYFVGFIKGVGKVYMQSAVDCSCSIGFARLCVNKLPMNSVALVHEKILPFYDQHNIARKSNSDRLWAGILRPTRTSWLRTLFGCSEH